MLDAFNSQLLVNSTYSVMGPDVKDPKVFRCPADQSTWTDPRVGMEMPRVRSYSMNQGIGCGYSGGKQDPGHGELGHWLVGSPTAPPDPWKTYIKEGDISGILGPSDLFVLLEEHPDSINDAAFAVYMPQNPSDPHGWIDVPGAIHGGTSCGFSFADGHAIVHKWSNPATINQIIWAADQTAGLGNGGAGAASPGAALDDFKWVGHHASCLPVGVNLYYPWTASGD
jgi:prepilin-type processing-associated H-X9-DG protein